MGWQNWDEMAKVGWDGKIRMRWQNWDEMAKLG